MINPNLIQADCLYKTKEAAELIGVTIKTFFIRTANRGIQSTTADQGHRQGLLWRGSDLHKLIGHTVPMMHRSELKKQSDEALARIRAMKRAAIKRPSETPIAVGMQAGVISNCPPTAGRSLMRWMKKTAVNSYFVSYFVFPFPGIACLCCLINPSSAGEMASAFSN